MLSHFLGWAGSVSQCGASSGLQTEMQGPHQKGITKEAVLIVGPSFLLCFYSFSQQTFQGHLLCTNSNIFPPLLYFSVPSSPPASCLLSTFSVVLCNLQLFICSVFASLLLPSPFDKFPHRLYGVASQFTL